MTAQEKNVEREEIKQQLYRYCHAVDRIDYELGRSVFAEEAVVDYGPTYQGSGLLYTVEANITAVDFEAAAEIAGEGTEEGTK